jgi:hypothetical protein
MMLKLLWIPNLKINIYIIIVSIIARQVIHNGEFKKVSDPDLVEYINLLYKSLGIDIDFEKFKLLSDCEKKSLERDIKINNILK